MSLKGRACKGDEEVMAGRLYKGEKRFIGTVMNVCVLTGMVLQVGLEFSGYLVSGAQGIKGTCKGGKRFIVMNIVG